ncbi:hypothetical protein [Desulfofundulus sp.]|uniref:hypothetical protein n=1 Tax=Desulfofundulus sp. TaxID=2282750 RepID=UPI003C73B659
MTADEKLKSGVLVWYTCVHGEVEFAEVVLLELREGETPEQAVENYFKDFFADETIFEDGVYYSADFSEAVGVNSWKVVPPGDYAVLRKYL